MMGVSAIEEQGEATDQGCTLKQDWDAVFGTGIILVVTIREEFVSLQSVNTQPGMLFGPGCL